MWLPIALLSVFANSTIAAPSFPIVMSMEYCYEDSPCSDAEWTFFEDGRMEDDFGGEGSWRIVGRQFMLMYDHGSEYRGILDRASGCMDGRNAHADGREGTFTACL